MLKLKIGNMQKTNNIEKGISTVMLEPMFVHALKKYFATVKFDLVLYSTPPITLGNAVKYIKERDGAKTYLMLKDIFPQNAVDLGMMKETGLKSILYRYFRRKEKKLYALSDMIGCMSQANVNYVLMHNPEILNEKVEICPNCIEVENIHLSEEERYFLRERYGIPMDKLVFVYGGNLGKPQGIDFMIKCLRNQKNNQNVYFLIVGSGTEYGKIEEFVNDELQENVKLMSHLPKEDYERMIAACDVGMIFLDSRFTIPNFPSRLLAYMQARLPILAVTDPNTDIGEIIVEGQFGWHTCSGDVAKFNETVSDICNMPIEQYGQNGYEYLKKHYSAERVYRLVMHK